MTEVELAFNEIWQVPQTRPWLRKFSDYLSIFLIFPILLALAISLSSGFLSHPDIQRILSGLLPTGLFSATSSLATLVLTWLSFTFIYLVMPNTRVYFLSALLGGVLGGSVWQIAHLIITRLQTAATYYNAIYGALYHLLFLVIWMFWSWVIVLFGSEVSYAHQNLERLRARRQHAPLPPEPVDEYLALAVLALIGSRYLKRHSPLSLEELGQVLVRGEAAAQRVLGVLKGCDLVLEMTSPNPGESPRYLPAMPLEQVTVQEVLDCSRQARGEALMLNTAPEPALEAVWQRLFNTALPSPLASLSLLDLVQSLEQPPPLGDHGRKSDGGEGPGT